MIKKINAFNTKIRFKSFGKTTIGANKVKKVIQCSSSCNNYSCNICKNQKQKDKDLMEKRTKQINQAVMKIKEIRQGRAGICF